MLRRAFRLTSVAPPIEDTSDVIFNFAVGPRYTLANGCFVGLTFGWEF